MTTNPADYAPTVVATYSVRRAGTSAEAVAVDVLALLAADVLLVDLSDHDRRADTVRLRAKGDAVTDAPDR